MKHLTRNKLSTSMLVFLLILPSCAGMRSGPEPTARLEDVVAQESGARQELRLINERLFASVRSAPSVQDYVLGEGDLLQVSVFEAQELKAEGRVSARGFITLQLLGAVQVKELTTREAEQKVEDLYRLKYIQNPHVNIFVKEQVSGKITLMGAVKKPGTHPYLARQNLFEALALGEGLAETAGKMVQIRRAGDDPDRPQTFLVDLDELVRGGAGGEINIEIKSGDVLYVPEAGMIYVDGAVRKPGTYPIKKKMTVPEAIVAAGGFTPWANESRIKLLRPREGGKPDVVQLSFKDLQEGGTHQLEVKDRDIVFVEMNKMEAFMYGLRISGFGGIIGVGYDPPAK